MRRILLASDYSSASRRALATAIRMAKDNRAKLTILHVIAPFIPVSPELYTTFEAWDEIEAESRTWAQRHLDRLTASAAKAGVRATGILVEGAAAREIVRVANRTKAELVIIGTHGRSGLTKFFLGSVAGAVVATSRCPVMTVRGR